MNTIKAKTSPVKNCFKLPNSLIADTTIPYSAKSVCAVIYAYKDEHNEAMISAKKICKILHCDANLVFNALNILEKKGYIRRKRNYRNNNETRKLQYDKNSYVCLLDMSADFTFVPRSSLYIKTTYASFSLYLYLLNQGFRKGRAFPSINKIINAVGISKSTILRAAEMLQAVGLIIKQQCKTVKNCFTSSSYFLVRLINNAIKAFDKLNLDVPPLMQSLFPSALNDTSKPAFFQYF